MSTRHGGTKDWQATRADMLQLLRQVAAARDTVSYGDFGRMLADPMHHRNPALYDLLRDICYDEREAGRPNLCALVVRKSDGMPGKGFFEYAALHGDDASDPRAYWEKKVEACWDYYAPQEDKEDDT
jgi:hypothetical protein